MRGWRRQCIRLQGGRERDRIGPRNNRDNGATDQVCPGGFRLSRQHSKELFSLGLKERSGANSVPSVCAKIENFADNTGFG